MRTTCPPNGRLQSCANQTEGVHADVTCANFVRNSHYRFTVLFTTGRAPLFLCSTHEQRQFLKVVGRMEWHLPRLARHSDTGTSARRAGLRRAGHECRAQVARSTAGDAVSDAEEITKTVSERATSVSKGNAAYAAMEAVIMERVAR